MHTLVHKRLRIRTRFVGVACRPLQEVHNVGIYNERYNEHYGNMYTHARGIYEDEQFSDNSIYLSERAMESRCFFFEMAYEMYCLAQHCEYKQMLSVYLQIVT